MYKIPTYDARVALIKTKADVANQIRLAKSLVHRLRTDIRGKTSWNDDLRIYEAQLVAERLEKYERALKQAVE